MNLQEFYNQLYKNSIKAISTDHYEIDPWIDATDDDRFGLSLIIRPSSAVKSKINRFLKDLKEVEPHQYYYPSSDIHITVISVISCYSGLKRSTINTPEYAAIIEKCVKNLGPLTISFKGITASPSCIMIQGFVDNDHLDELRKRLRQSFKTSDLEQSMDERYLIQTAHATVFRFRQTLDQKEKFLEILETYRDYDFGTFKVSDLELTYNDWYHRIESVNKLHRFDLEILNNSSTD